ncbi:hypothetical protein DL546_007578 [Coniochaeta pulveracea]|uniref:F-box domain-containing protein n=1 Tax=Coniochaeta pulveracea TaxID=177199 RepID=A0A420YC50_9PEZI|nr:hypothetical protein DL546_007578 [Coniochaeta pulveracea]
MPTAQKEGSVVNSNSDAAIIRVTSYHRKDFEASVITAESGRHNDVRSSIFQNLGATQGLGTGMGQLQRLPLELAWSICLYLDIQSALRFSQVNRSARQCIASIPQYRRLGKHALECIWALSRTGLASRIDVLSLHATLTTERCVVCGLFGGFIFLPTCARCCVQCIASAPSLRVVPLRALSKASGVPIGRLKRSREVFNSIPGKYSSNFTQQRRLRCFVSGQYALEVLRKRGDQDAQIILDALPDSPVWRFMTSATLPYADLTTDDPDVGRACKGCQVAMEAHFCEANFLRRERLYSRRGFLEHFQHCQEAQAMWIASEGGTVTVEEPEFTKYGGGTVT